MNSDAPETIRARLLKIQKLADQGLAGEAAAAAAALQKLCQKHGITLDEISRPTRKDYSFAFKNPWERRVLAQCAFFVCQRPEGDPLMGIKRPGRFVFELSEAEYIDLVDCYAHYRKAWAEHMEEVFEAFLCKHRLFGPSKSKTNDEPMDPLKLERLVNMVRSMSGRTWNKPTARLTA